MLETMLITFKQVISSVPHGAILFVMFIVGWKVYDLITPFKFNDELVEKDNPAVGITLSGFVIALGIGFAGTLFGANIEIISTNFLSSEVILIVANCAIVIFLTILSAFITDKVVLSKFCVKKELIEDKNVGTGFVVAGNFIASGLVLNGAMTGESDTTLLAFRDIVIYWAVGQVFVVIAGVIYQAITKYDLHKEIEERDNAAVGLAFSGFAIAIGLIMRAAILNATSDIVAELASIAVIGIIGFVLLLLTRIIADKVLMPSSPLSDEVGKQKNIAAAGIAFASFILVAIIISSAISNIAMKTIEEAPIIQEDIQEDIQEGGGNTNENE